MLLSFSFFRIQCFSFPGRPLGTKDGWLPDPLRLLPSESPFLPAPSPHTPSCRGEEGGISSPGLCRAPLWLWQGLWDAKATG